jgi:histidinol phosphatase-like PHP family hydrolase
MSQFFDHDLHIHSQLSLCSGDPEQTPERILAYAKENGLRTVCLTDHHWNENVPGASSWYQKQDTAHIRQALPLPQEEGIRFLFGCETDMDQFHTVGLAREHFDQFDFVIIPTTHLHMKGFTIPRADAESEEHTALRARFWVERLEALLSMDLPFHKIGIAHLACSLMNKESREAYLQTMDLIPTADMERLFARAAEIGVGIELNMSDMQFADGEADRVLRMFRVAKSCGCKFYCGTDAHHPNEFADAAEVFERAVTLLGLTEQDKFTI